MSWYGATDTVVCDIESFMAAYLPFVPSEEDLEECLEAILGLMHDNETDEDSEIAVSPSEDLDDLLRKFIEGDGNKEKTIERLEHVAESISKSACIDNRPKNKYKYRSHPSHSVAWGRGLVDSEDNNVVRISGCFIADGVEPTTANIAVPVRCNPVQNSSYRYVMSARASNNLHMRAVSKEIMRVDVRRIFTLGITVESDMMTLWYHSITGTGYAISEQFNFVAKPKLLVQIFMSLLFATEEELGYDTTVTRHEDGTFTFEIPEEPKRPSRFYRTIKPLLYYGYGTQTWLVQEVTSKMADATVIGRHCMLKNEWRALEFTQTEKQIQDAIFSDIEAFWADESPSSHNLDLQSIKMNHHSLVTSGKYKKLFLTIEADYVGRSTKPLAPRSKEISYLFTRYDDEYTHPGIKDETIRNCFPCRQYHTVYPEVCELMENLEVLGEAMDVLRQTLIPLQLLLCGGWVHRDIGSCSIMANKNDIYDQAEPWKVKLAELKYAKKYLLPSVPLDWRQKRSVFLPGCRYFMAWEVMHQMHVHSIADEYSNDDSDFDIASVFSRESMGVSSFRAARDEAKDASCNSEMASVHNFQHDLESLWWTIVYVVTAGVDWGPSLKFAKYVFQNTREASQERTKFFEGRQQLHQDLKPSIRPFGDFINAMRQSMYWNYIDRRKSGRLSDPGSYADIHTMFETWFEWLEQRSSQWAPVRLNQKHVAYPSTVIPEYSTDNEDQLDQQHTPDQSTGESDSEQSMEPAPVIAVKNTDTNYW